MEPRNQWTILTTQWHTWRGYELNIITIIFFKSFIYRKSVPMSNVCIYVVLVIWSVLKVMNNKLLIGNDLICDHKFIFLKKIMYLSHDTWNIYFSSVISACLQCWKIPICMPHTLLCCLGRLRYRLRQHPVWMFQRESIQQLKWVQRLLQQKPARQVSQVLRVTRETFEEIAGEDSFTFTINSFFMDFHMMIIGS